MLLVVKFAKMRKQDCSNGSKWLRHCLMVLTFVGCLVGFGFIVKDQVLKFFKKKTGVSVEYAFKTSHELPLIVFCNHDPYNRNVSFDDLLDPLAYESVLVRPRVLFLGFTEFEFGNMSDFRHRWKQLDTLYNGVCQAFVAQQPLLPYNYLTFQVLSGPVDVFLLQPGEELFLLWQNWGFAAVSFLTAVHENVVVSVHASSYQFLDDGLNCRRRSDRDFTYYTDCLRGRVEDKLRELDCLPPPLMNFTEGVKKRLCTLEERETAMSAFITSTDAISKGDCKISCSMRAYEVQTSSFVPIRGSPNSIMEGFGLYVFFPSNIEIEHEQYVLYDLANVIAAVGGALGLFLGFSCLALVSKIIDRFFSFSRVAALSPA